MSRVHLIIRGRVQGVFFRGSTHKLAASLGLTGWVRNRIDDSVEVVAEGAPQHVSALRVWARSGPPGAVVESIEEIVDAETGEFAAFYVRGSI